MSKNTSFNGQYLLLVGVIICTCLYFRSLWLSQKAIKSVGRSRPRDSVEAFDDMLGGYIDLRYGSIGCTNYGNAGDWIMVGTFSLSTANQEIGIVLEVFGVSRQTFNAKFSNSATAANPPTLFMSNLFGSGNVVFPTAVVVQSRVSGLASTYQLYLQLGVANPVSIPVAWYLKGVAATDVVSITNVTTSMAPTGTVIKAVEGRDMPKAAPPFAKASIWVGWQVTIGVETGMPLTNAVGDSTLIGGLALASNNPPQNGKFTAPYGGLYAVSAWIRTPSWGTKTQLELKMYVSNNSIASPTFKNLMNAGGVNYATAISTIIPLSAGESFWFNIWGDWNQSANKFTLEDGNLFVQLLQRTA